jgi:hypothetical protein
VNIPFAELQAAGVDLGAIVTKDFLNDFSAAHFKHVPAIYTGKQRFTDFGNDIEIAYTFEAPITFDLARQISPERFKGLWHSHLLHKGADKSLRLDQIVSTPANLSLEAPSVDFTITCYQGHTSTVVLVIDFNWKIDATCAVSLTNGLLTLEPLKVEFAPSGTKLLDLIRKKLEENTDRRENANCGMVGSPQDPKWCAEAEQFILFLLNSVLSTQMTNFVRSWTLPNAIQLFDGVTLAPNYLAIHDEMIILGGTVSSAPIGLSPIHTQVESLLIEFRERASKEIALATDDDIRRWKAEESPTINWLNSVVHDLERRIEEERIGGISEIEAAGSTLALCSNDRLFDILAKKYLAANNSWSGGTSVDHLVKVDIGWWFRLENAAGTVVPGGIQISASVSVGGSISLCYFDLDPKHFGSWACSGISLELAALPNPPGFALRGYPNFQADGIYLRADLLTQAIGLQVPGWPGWANDVLGWVTGMMTFPLLAAIRAIISLLNIRIAKYPAFFPGTGLPWTPNMISTPSNAGPYLVFEASPSFN